MADAGEIVAHLKLDTTAWDAKFREMRDTVWELPSPGLSDETIDRIADRVADILEQRAAVAANKAEYDEKVRRFEAGDWNARPIRMPRVRCHALRDHAGPVVLWR